MADAKKAPTRTRRAVSKKKNATRKVVKKAPAKKAGSKKVSKNKETKTPKKLKPARKDTLQKSGKISLPQSISLALFSSALLPANSEQFAIGTARIAGLAMVVVGGFFSVFHVLSLPTTLSALEAIPQVAQTSSSSTENTEPPPQVSVPGGTLSGTAPVTITVEAATAVKVLAYSHIDFQTNTLGDAQLQSGTTWLYNWDTTQYENGAYVLEVQITNQHGTYNRQLFTSNTIYNAPPPDPDPNQSGATSTDSGSSSGSGGSTSTSGSGSSGSTSGSGGGSTNTVTNAITSFTATHDTARHELVVTTQGTNINRVLVYAQRTNGVREYLGLVQNTGAGTIEFVHDTFGMSAGDYAVSADVYFVDATRRTTNSTTITIAPINPQTTTTDQNSSSTTAVTTAPVSSTNLQPPVDIQVLNPTRLQNTVDVVLKVSHAQTLELYAVSKQSLTAHYIGAPRKINTTDWVLRFDTTNKPNGQYELYASVRNAYGAYQSTKFPVTISNSVISAPSTVVSPTDTFTNLNTAVTPNDTSLDADETNAPQTIGDTFRSAPELTDAEQLVKDLKAEFRREFERLASAIRMNDTDAVEKSKKRLFELRKKVTEQLTGSEQQSLLLDDIDSALDRATREVERTNKIVTERTDLAATTDTDKDGISDFDEVTLYNTDPLVADTDGDGFTDGAEILNGYDPLDPEAEALVTYESPQEKGIVREDILSVDEILVSEKSDVKPITETFITGKGLPNSYVTLYIFSTPIVVTVKTESDGSFMYRFDKELEDGEHEIYAGVTDNAGKIIAKSNPLRFVKEAEAFTPVDFAASSNVVSNTEGTAIVTEKVLLIILSISVVAIGVVLILIGMHMDAIRRKHLVAEDIVSAEV